MLAGFQLWRPVTLYESGCSIRSLPDISLHVRWVSGSYFRETAKMPVIGGVRSYSLSAIFVSVEPPYFLVVLQIPVIFPSLVINSILIAIPPLVGTTCPMINLPIGQSLRTIQSTSSQTLMG